MKKTKVKRLKPSKELTRLSWLRIGTQVVTPHGVGILLNVEVPANGLYYELNRARFLVWYGCGDHEHTEWTSENVSKHISMWYTAKELEPLL